MTIEVASPFYKILSKIARTLIVSCQADDGEPLAAPEHIKALAMSAIMGGAKALRLEGVENIKALRGVTDLPIIGLSKSKNILNQDRLNSVYITASFAEAKELALAGSDIIALDATARPRADNLSLAQTIERIHNELGKAVWADVGTYEEAVEAQNLGADVISTTLFGYTKETERTAACGPDFALLKKMTTLTVPVVLVGRVWLPEEVT